MVGDVVIAADVAGVADWPAWRTSRAGRPAGWAGVRVRRLLVGGAWTVAAVAAFAVYLRLAGTRAVNSDGASTALAAWDMLHGNVLLRGWSLPDANFSSTEIPQYALVELAVGLGQNVVHIAAAMTYALVLLLVALVAKAGGDRPGGGRAGRDRRRDHARPAARFGHQRARLLPRPLRHVGAAAADPADHRPGPASALVGAGDRVRCCWRGRSWRTRSCCWRP